MGCKEECVRLKQQIGLNTGTFWDAKCNQEIFTRKIRNFESETTSEPIFYSLKKASCASVEGSALIDNLNWTLISFE